MGAMTDGRKQVITGVVPPETAEAMIREVWPSVARHLLVARFGKALTEFAGKLARTVVLLPLAILVALAAWMIMALFYFGKVAPFVAMRYTLTNRRLMIRRGLKAKPRQQVPLKDIDDVQIHKDSNSDFFMAGTLVIISRGDAVLTLRGVPGPEAFRHTILDACKAWVPGKANAPIIPASAP